MVPTQLFHKLWRPLQGLFLQVFKLVRMLEDCDNTKINHVHHRGITSHQEQESNLHNVVFGQVTRLKLFTNEETDEILLWSRKPLVDKTRHVFEQFTVGV